MGRSIARAPRRQGKGRPRRALDELASDYQRHQFFAALENARVFNKGRAADKAGLTLAVINRLLHEDPAFAARYQEIHEQHREEFVAAVGDAGVGKDGRSPDPALLKLYGQLVFPEIMNETKTAVQVNVSLVQIDAMNPDQLTQFITETEKRVAHR